MDLKQSKACYSRSHDIFYDLRECNGCGNIKMCACIDSSDGEYGATCLCTACLNTVQEELAVLEEATPIVERLCPLCNEMIDVQADNENPRWFCGRKRCWDEIARRNQCCEKLPPGW